MVVSFYSFPVPKTSSIFNKRLYTQKKSFYIILIQNLFKKGAQNAMVSSSRLCGVVG
jgi:hypothetical protein